MTTRLVIIFKSAGVGGYFVYSCQLTQLIMRKPGARSEEFEVVLLSNQDSFNDQDVTSDEDF